MKKIQRLLDSNLVEEEIDSGSQRGTKIDEKFLVAQYGERRLYDLEFKEILPKDYEVGKLTEWKNYSPFWGKINIETIATNKSNAHITSQDKESVKFMIGNPIIIKGLKFVGVMSIRIYFLLVYKKFYVYEQTNNDIVTGAIGFQDNVEVFSI